ncbi:MAG: N-acetylmuramidase family protein [Ignavibacteria bacterium]|nr:N-acetylmuramidase family protein [Ignavibacteria bacterium]
MQTLKLRSKGDSVRLLQELLNKAGYNLVVDGDFGKNTEKTVKDFQKKNKLIVDGIVGTKTWIKINAVAPKALKESTKKFLAEKDLIDLAKELKVEVAAVKAVYEVESSGRGFLTSGKPKILFEGHIFWKRLKVHGLNPLNLKAGNEDVLYAKWTTKFYKGGEREYDRLNKAIKIHNAAALESASWGIFQIMGYHYKKVGYNTVEDYVKAMNKSERFHLKAFGKFIKSEGLVKHLKTKAWNKFARGYNGAGYKKNKYHTKLAAAYKKYSN